MDENIAIKVDGVSKTFKLPHERHSSIKTALINIGRTKRGYEKQHVLKNISFEIKKGEFFGIVGRNGSGKSTLLKLLAGIYTPDKGTITINGKLTPFIELGVGFNPELSGRENVFLNGALLGFNRKEMEAMYDEIVEFAELERFMDQKLKNYSSGMQVRLAFSIAIRANSDILVLDEVLAVGDEAFQKKCNDFFKKIKKDKTKTIILVTHSMENVRQFCTQAMLIKDGRIADMGDPANVADLYSGINKQGMEQKPIKNNKDAKLTYEYSISDKDVIFTLKVKPKIDIDDAIIGIVIQRDMDDWVYRWANDNTDINHTINLAKDKQIVLNISIQNIFPSGTYHAVIWVRSRDRQTTYAVHPNAVTFDIVNKNHQPNYWKPNSNFDIQVQ